MTKKATLLRNLERAIKLERKRDDDNCSNRLAMDYFDLKYDGKAIATNRDPRIIEIFKNAGFVITPTFVNEENIQYYRVSVEGAVE